MCAENVDTVSGRNVRAQAEKLRSQFCNVLIGRCFGLNPWMRSCWLMEPIVSQYVHFTSDEISAYLVKAGFDSYEVMEIDDPYVAIGDSPEEAELNLGEYLVNMYGLCKA